MKVTPNYTVTWTLGDIEQILNLFLLQKPAFAAEMCPITSSLSLRLVSSYKQDSEAGEGSERVTPNPQTTMAAEVVPTTAMATVMMSKIMAAEASDGGGAAAGGDVGGDGGDAENAAMRAWWSWRCRRRQCGHHLLSAFYGSV